MTSPDYTRMIFITANVASLMNESKKVLENWSATVAKEIGDQKPVFAAIHLQVRRKITLSSMPYNTINNTINVYSLHIAYKSPVMKIRNFFKSCNDGVRLLPRSECSGLFGEHGMCNIYYCKAIAQPALYDYRMNSYVTVKGDLHESANQSKNVDFERIGGNTENPVGFMMTRWLLHNKSFDFVNLILSPDNSPLDGCLNWPSENSHRRRHEFSLILERLETYMNEECVVFFGNFNCSIDCERFLKDQMNLNKARIVENDNNDQLEAYDLSLRKIFTVTRTQFNFHENHDWLFGTCNGQLVRKYDCELEPFLKGSLYEPNIYFAPTDPYELGPTFGKEPNFVRTECPAWRSRVLINQRTREKIHHDSFSSSGLYYGLVGEAEYLGQSKPVAMICTICLK
ncbi:putative type I inositol-1,4,5-trisphosphate 5-phosphatase [Trichinella spiralis]|uniref:Type I inositol 1,4,5-trisphosphate 5-phosphatase n=1 Tax=Trichinella spiralis TaxID=6334 RepID=E5SUB0_TRISP|nr:putative type I inositol-1,4,5-trisphosphate 5-phosphatase [Trichinella spiralis]KRY33617.1 Type I inositol 1,4,5-trisphosphate 5-phosphatase [Trichinella spiralis]